MFYTDQEKQILDAGFEAITKNGVRSFTVESLAHKLGMSKKTIYKSYPTKEWLIKEIVQYITGQVAAMIESIRANESNPALQFIQVMEFIAKMAGRFSEHRLLEFKTKYPKIWKDLEEFRLNRREDFYMILKSAQESGLARAELDMKVVATIYTHLINTTFQPEFLLLNDLPIGDTIRGFVGVAARGIFTDKGIKAIEAYHEQNNI